MELPKINLREILMSQTDTVAHPERLPLIEAAQQGTYGGYSTLRKKVASGDLPAERVGRRIFVRQTDLEAMPTPVVGHPTDQAIIDKAIDRIVASAPRLTADQRDRLAGILGGGR